MATAIIFVLQFLCAIMIFVLMILHTTTMLMAVEKQTKTTHRRRIREGITDQKYAEYIANTPH